jgi:O-antigen/teichoic acid export membrane protein
LRTAGSKRGTDERAAGRDLPREAGMPQDQGLKKADALAGKTTNDASGTRILRSFAWQGSAVAVGQGISWIATLYVIRLLQPGDYGLMAMAQLWMGFLLLVSDLGIGSAVIQQLQRLDRRQLRVMFGLVLLTNAVGIALTLAAAPLVAAFFDEPRVIPLLHVMSIAFLLMSLYVLPQALLARDLSFDRKARAEVVATAVSALVSVVMALEGFGVWALVGGSLALHGGKAIAFQVARPCLPWPSFALREGFESLRFGGLMTLSRVLWWASGNVDIAIAGRVLGDAALGIYSVALNLSSMPVNKIMPILNQVSFAAFSRMQDDRDRVKRNVHRALQTVGLVAFPTFIGLAAVAPEAIELLLGEKWRPAVVPCQILCLILPLRPVSGVLAPALFGIGRPGVNVTNRALTFVVMGIAFWVGVRWGLIGICVAWIVAYPPVVLATSVRALRALGIPAREAASDIAFFALATGIMGLALWIVRVALGSDLSDGALLGCLVATGSFVYTGIVLAYKPALLRDLGSLFRRDA